MAVDLDRTVLLAAGAVMLGVAVAILAARPGNGVNRALAALVGARGAAVLLPQVSNDPAWAWAALGAQPYFALAVTPLALYALHAFRRPEGPHPRAGWLAFGAVAALDLAYFADHHLLQSLASGPTDVGALRAADGIHFTAFGPLAVVASSTGLALAGVGLSLAVLYRQRVTDGRGPLVLLVASGLLVGALFDGASRLSALTALLDHGAGFPWLPWGWAVVVLPTLALLPGLLGLLVLGSRPAWHTPPLRKVERVAVVLGCLAGASGFLRLVVPADSDVAGSGLVPVLMGVWRLAMPLFIGYALMLHPSPALAPTKGIHPTAAAPAAPPPVASVRLAPRTSTRTAKATASGRDAPDLQSLLR